MTRRGWTLFLPISRKETIARSDRTAGVAWMAMHGKLKESSKAGRRETVTKSNENFGPRFVTAVEEVRQR